MDKGLKEMYYIAIHNMNKCINYEDVYYRIVGFYYVSDCQKGFVLIDPDSSLTYKLLDQQVKKVNGITEILLEQDKKAKYNYICVYYPLWEEYTMI